MDLNYQRIKHRLKHRLLKLRYRDLYFGLRSILLRHDPINLVCDGCPEDEYDLEISTILPRLRRDLLVSEIQRIIHKEFSHWFGEDTAGPESAYEGIATDVWKLLQI